MPLINAWFYTKQVIDMDKFLQNTRNIYQVVSQKPYQSKKIPEDIGVTVTLLVLHDDTDYGVDKNGHKRDNNVLNTFDVTILNSQTYLPIKKGDKVSLGRFLPDKSYVIGFNLLLRFADIKKVGATDVSKS